MEKSKKRKSIRKTREFHLGDILSITTGHLVSPHGMDGVYDILSFMTRDNLFTHQLPRASDECKPYLLKQHPQLKKINASNVDDWDEWLVEQVKRYGKELVVKPISSKAHTKKNPLKELEEKMGSDKVITVIT